jgi:UDP-N-acetylglucosamine/UDP-N-acetylgalactosamine diphosphorylase
MISFNGFEHIIADVYQNKQEHVFQYWEELNNTEKKILIEESGIIDFDLMNKLYEKKTAMPTADIEFYPAGYIALQEPGKHNKDFETAIKTGKEYISKGKTAVLLVAGGQGTRLGFNGPKGMLPIGPVSSKSLFQIHAEKILFLSKKNNISIPWLIMTSKENHTDTIDYFTGNKFFGLNKEDVFFLSQKMLPSLDINGKLILKTKSSLYMNPDGHGGVLSALSSSGLLEELKKRKIETISYFQVDNPLVNILDPVFIGYHMLNGSDVSSKGVMKISPEEKVGVFVKFKNGQTGIMEYSDLSHEKQIACDNKGKLLYCMGNIAIHCFKLSFIESVISETNLSLPFHTAQKKIIAFKDGKEKEVNSLKYEKFIFDTITLTGKNTILETRREEEFAPVKNAYGVDSPKTAKELMSDLYRKWLTEKKIVIPDNVKVIEISPLFALEADDLAKNIIIPDLEKVYIE